MRILIVTAGDDAFMPLLQGLLGSLEQWEPRPFTDIAVFDLGLSPQNRDWVARHALHLPVPGWDLAVAPDLRQAQPHLRALTVRPFLPAYFPGYDVYLWIDADAWVQERFALEWLCSATAGGGMAAVPQIDRAYRQTAIHLEWRKYHMRQYFGEEAAQRTLWDRYFNAGAFALPAGAPHWQAWARHFAAGLAATGGSLCCDQTALNHALWVDDLPVHPLPAVCNWLCHLALPGFDPATKKFHEPIWPGRPIGILHLTADSKDVQLQVNSRGESRAIGLRFPQAAISQADSSSR